MIHSLEDVAYAVSVLTGLHFIVLEQPFKLGIVVVVEDHGTPAMTHVVPPLASVDDSFILVDIVAFAPLYSKLVVSRIRVSICVLYLDRIISQVFTLKGAVDDNTISQLDDTISKELVVEESSFVHDRSSALIDIFLALGVEFNVQVEIVVLTHEHDSVTVFLISLEVSKEEVSGLWVLESSFALFVTSLVVSREVYVFGAHFLHSLGYILFALLNELVEDPAIKLHDVLDCTLFVFRHKLHEMFNIIIYVQQVKTFLGTCSQVFLLWRLNGQVGYLVVLCVVRNTNISRRAHSTKLLDFDW